MKRKIEQIIENFELQITKVFEIIEFDKEMLELVIKQLKELKTSIVNFGLENSLYHPDTEIMLLQTLINSGPKQTKYKSVYNQCLVLLVSHFASAIGSVFNEVLTYTLNHKTELPKKLSDLQLKFSISELRNIQGNLESEIGKIVARRSDISFQDMKSIARAFEDYCNVTVERTKAVENIIASQALRHAIVHNGEVVDNKCFRQLQATNNRCIQKTIARGNSIAIQVTDLDLIKNDMKLYINQLKASSFLIMEG